MAQPANADEANANANANTNTTTRLDSNSNTSSIKDPLSLKKHLQNEEGFKKLSYWDQLDAMVAHQACPETLTAAVTVLAGITSLVNGSILYLLVAYCQVLDGAGAGIVDVDADNSPVSYQTHEVLCKTAIAWCSLAAFLGIDGMYANPIIGYSSVFQNWQVGTVKEPFFCGRTGVWSGILPKQDFRRNIVDGPLLSLAFALSRLWVACSPVPSPAAAWVYFLSTILLLVFNYSSYIGASGMYHGPLSAYLFLKYTNTSGALSVLQLTLVLIYIGCGIGKMGPWFVQVFIQEWTMPAWSKFVNLRPFLYKDMPKDNTATTLATIAGYGAASTEWLAGVLLCLPSSILVGTFLESFAVEGGNGDNTSCSLPVAAGIVIIISMHIYIILHLPIIDVWILNILPAYLVYYAFYLAPTTESGFDYAGFATLPTVWQYACYAFMLFVVFGQIHTDKVSYTLCYRFWAGNWGHSYFFISKSGIAKIQKSILAKRWNTEEPGVYKMLASDKWLTETLLYMVLGMSFTGQLNHRVLPKIIHKVTNGKSLTEYRNDGNRVVIGWFLVQWLMGLAGNCSIRAFHALAVLQELCEFEAGECRLINVHSFGSHQGLLDASGGGGSNATTEWIVMDAKDGVVEKGTVSIQECLSYTCPSACKEKDD